MWDPGLYDGRHAFVWRHGEALVDLLAPRQRHGPEVRLAARFDRPTTLDSPDGPRQWVEMFCGEPLGRVPADRCGEFLSRVEDAARPELLRGEGWVADYRRLRVVAVKPA